MDIHGKVALVTGAAHRVGKVIALALAGRGAHVVVHYNRSEEAARETVAEIRALGVQAITVKANLGNPLEIEDMFTQIEAFFGRLEILVNSASTFQPAELLELTLDDWNYTMAINLRAPFQCSQLAAHLMLARGAGGAIVNVADVAGQRPWPKYPHHSVSKAGLLMLTQVMAKSLGPDIRVNAVVPGPVLKPEHLPDARWHRLGQKLPLKRTGRPENVGQAVAALVENDFITGAILNVDGGDSLLGSLDVP
jgi:NAD(P)-dependent dehydrogenase (short-subunit alcohol dehydrogenase family)